MLASPAEDAAEIIRRLGAEVWVEDKYDGIRAQLHKRGSDVRLYRRDLHDVSSQFPEVVDAARDAALGRRGRRRDPRLQGRPRPAVHQPPGAARSQDARRRRSRRTSRSSTSRSTSSRSAPGTIPTATPPSSRCCASRSGSAANCSTRSTCRWSTMAAGSRDRISAVAHDEDELEAAFADARARRNEGLMVKDPTAATRPAVVDSAG